MKVVLLEKRLQMAQGAGMDAATLIMQCRLRGLTIATAESCTGGLLAAALTDVAGASAVFHHGLICYANAAKTRWLGVPAALIEQHGAVSAAVAEAMAAGLLAHTNATLAISTTGIAGPDGGSAEKPVGLVYLGCATVAGGVRHQRLQLAGNRAAVRQQAVAGALAWAYQSLTVEQGFSV